MADKGIIKPILSYTWLGYSKKINYCLLGKFFQNIMTKKSVTAFRNESNNSDIDR